MSAGASSKRYHGFQYGVGRIIESQDARDKRSCKKTGKRDHGAGIREALIGASHPAESRKTLPIPVFSSPDWQIAQPHNRLDTRQGKTVP
jgi:hypothetical protein